MEEGVRKLMEADQIIGHNIISFDIPALQKVYPWFKIERKQAFDTLVMSMLLWPDLKDRDMAKVRADPEFPRKMIGLHRLEAWGYRLGFNKMEYTGGFEAWSEVMQEYCEIDVEVTDRLFKLIDAKQIDPRAVELEHEVKFICVNMERAGFAFDREKAEKLTTKLLSRRAKLETELQQLFPPWEVHTPFTPKVNNAKLGYQKGVETIKVKKVVFNPGSRQHIENRLKKLRGWKPKEYTDSGQAKVDETVLAALPWPEAKLLSEYFLIQKRLGQIAEGQNAWLKLEKNGRIHGQIITNGAVTGRATHRRPNIAQVPAVGAEYGAECRECFTVSEGKVQVGIDVSGLELRMLAHYMAQHDKGAYAKIVVEGDVHWVNVQALGLVPNGTIRDEATYKIHKIFRDGSKTFIYAFLYGAGGKKIGTIIFELGLDEQKKTNGDFILRKFFDGKPRATDATLTKVGNKLKDNFLAKTPALKKLVEGVGKVVTKRGYLIGLDGRHLHIRSSHAALNTLLQSAGALVCKRWMVELDREIEARGWRDKAQQVGWIHDELQFEVDPDIAEEFGEVAVACIVKAGTYLNVQVPLTGEFKIGKNWKDCH